MTQSDQAIRDALLLQQREMGQQLDEHYVPRDFDVAQAPQGLIKVILGPRRAGKSVFAMHLMQELGDFGYVNFDDERLADLTDYSRLIAAVDSIYEKPKRLLLDEIQNVPRWELLVNRLQRQGYDLTVTGSNAHLLSSELATHLTGRHVPIVLFPFSFAEYLRAQDRELTSVEKAEALRSYAENGGYPEPLLKGIPRGTYLTTLVRSILYADIVARHRIRAPQSLEDLERHLMANVTSPYSYRSLVRGTRLQSAHTVEKYLHHLEEAFLFFSLRRFSFKTREQARANRKVYAIDNGLITATAFQTSPNTGRLYENLVAIALHKREMEGSHECYTWRSPQGEEVDFVVKQGSHIRQLIQVCVSVDDPKTKARETRALLKASDDLRCRNLLVLTDSAEGKESASWHGLRGTVEYRPLWQWLLEEAGTTA